MKVAVIALLAACAFMGGCPEACKEGGTTWTAESRSPDGLWTATARSQQWGGPGAAYDGTTVYLKWVSQPPIEVLGFSHQYATMNLKMEWVAPRHLNVIYGESGRPGDKVEIGFQAIKCADVEITVQHVGAGETSSR
jgi:hypothetical protein